MSTGIAERVAMLNNFVRKVSLRRWTFGPRPDEDKREDQVTI